MDGVGTRAPYYSIGDVVVVYKSSPRKGFSTPSGGGRLPLLHWVAGLASWYMGDRNC